MLKKPNTLDLEDQTCTKFSVPQGWWLSLYFSIDDVLALMKDPNNTLWTKRQNRLPGQTQILQKKGNHLPRNYGVEAGPVTQASADKI